MNIAWPVLAELLLGSLFGMVDMMMLGRIANNALAAASVAAVGITNQPLIIGLSLVQALNVGGTAIIARYYGAKQNDKIEMVLKHVMFLSLFLLVLPIAVLGLIFTDTLMSFMGAQQDSIQVGRYYFKIIMAGFIFQSLNMSISAALRGMGETKMPMKINLKCNFFNVFGNAILIYGLLGFPRLGVTGAGISTAFSNVIASLLMFRYLINGKSVIKFSVNSPFKFNKYIIYDLIKIGIPASLEQLILRIGILLFTKIVASLGTVILAAHQIAINILGLSFQPGQAFGIAASSLVGRSLGAKNPKKAEEYAKETHRIGFMISTFMAMVFFLFGPQIVGLYSDDPMIIQNSSIALKIVAITQVFQSSQFILAGALRGAGDTFWPFISSSIGVILMRVTLAYIFVIIMGYGLIGAWMADFVDQLFRWILIHMRFRTGHWKHIRIE